MEKRYNFSRSFKQLGNGKLPIPLNNDLEILPSGKKNFPYHQHATWWELYFILSGDGTVRTETGYEKIEAKDCFIFPPGMALLISQILPCSLGIASKTFLDVVGI